MNAANDRHESGPIRVNLIGGLAFLHVPVHAVSIVATVLRDLRKRPVVRQEEDGSSTFQLTGAAWHAFQRDYGSLIHQPDDWAMD